MGFIDDLFYVFKDTIFLKNDSNLERQVEELKSLRSSVQDKDQIDKDIKLLELGIKGENEIAYELSNANLGLYVLRDVNINFDGIKAQIDYIVVSKGFTYLIECKNLIGNIYVDDKGQFRREYEFNGKKIKEAIYSPFTQASRHMDIIKKDWMSRRSNFEIALRGKYFDSYFYKPLVVLANSKSILSVKYAPDDIKNNIIKVDQLVNYIKKDLDEYDRDILSNQKEMLKLANHFLELNVNDYSSMADRYKKEINEKVNSFDNSNNINKNDLLIKLKHFRREKSRSMKLPAYYIYTDDEMNKIIALMPKTIEELKTILPAIKVKVHGEDILKLIN